MVMLHGGGIKARLNIIISGGTGSGKTTLLNTLSSFIPSDERVVTIEDAAELAAAAGTRGAAGNAAAEHRRQGRGHDPRLRAQRPAYAARTDHHRRVRGAETLDMLQAMNTGHDGSLATLPRQHAARRPRPAGNDDHDGRLRTAGQGDAAADRRRRRPDHSGEPTARRPAQDHAASRK